MVKTRFALGMLYKQCNIKFYVPVSPPDSPRVPRGWRASFSHLSLRAGRPSLFQPGRSTWTEARMPVPKLVGQEWM